MVTYLPDEHGRSLDESEPGIVEEIIFISGRIPPGQIVVEHNVEAEAEGDDEERVPKEKHEERFQDLEHGLD